MEFTDEEIKALKRMVAIETALGIIDIERVKCICGHEESILHYFSHILHCPSFLKNKTVSIPFKMWTQKQVDTSYSVIKSLIEKQVIAEFNIGEKRVYKIINPLRAEMNAKKCNDIVYIVQDRATSHLPIADDIPKNTYTHIPDDFLDSIVGYDDIKRLIKQTILSDRPVHLLFEGPPATAKSLILLECERLDGAKYAIGGSSTKVGLSDYIMEYAPKYLLIDEIDKMNMRDTSVLLSVMETGRLSIVKHDKIYEATIPLKVIAAANRCDAMPSELLSRFFRIKLPSYSTEKLIEVMRNVLIKRERVDPAFADEIAQMCVKNDLKDPRDAIRVARLAKTVDDAKTVIDTVKRYK